MVDKPGIRITDLALHHNRSHSGLNKSGETVEPIIVPGKNCWRTEKCARASVIVDAADYYHLVRTALAAAQRSVLIIGWDFDTRISLEPGAGTKQETLGDFFLALARRAPERKIAILKWSFGAKKQFLHPRAVWMLWKWYRTKAIEFRFDAAHPAGCSHHQKIVIMDDQVAVCGGIDISTARWDTSGHVDDDPRRRLPDGKPYEPWHDVTMMLEGPVAAALGDLCRDRWRVATGVALPAEPAERSPWPEELPAQFTDVTVGIARTRAEYGDVTEVREVEALFIDMIAAAKRFIYIENQYFTSAKLAAVIAQRMGEPDPPEIVMVMPRTANGWLEQKAMDAARIRLAREIARSDIHNRFHIYVPVTEKGSDIYVHAKVSIIDDRLLRVGSANLNNRSLGLDSECDVVIDAALEGNEKTPQEIARLRSRLLAEHLGVEPERFAAEFGRRDESLIATIEALRGPGRSLDLLDLVEPGPLDTFIAENELLDPESADGFLDPISDRGLDKRWREGLHRALHSLRRHN